MSKNNIKYIENFKTKSDFNSIKNKKRCWNTCKGCNNHWTDLNTIHVHMASFSDPEHFVNGNGIFFYCDNCKSKIKVKQ